MPLPALLRGMSLPSLAACLVGGAVAQPVPGPAWDEMQDNEPPGLVESAARNHLGRQPGDPAASLALAMALAANPRPSVAEAALPLMQSCSARHPTAAECAFALGVLQSARARDSAWKTLGLAPSIREAFQQAVQLAPAHLPYRAALMQFYLAAPTMAGGGDERVDALLRLTEPAYPSHARFLAGLRLVHQRRYEDAERALWSIEPGTDEALRRSLYDLLCQVGGLQLQAGQLHSAHGLFLRLVAREPSLAAAHYGVGRTHAERGAPQEAIEAYQQARRLRGRAALALDYREALAWLQMSQPARARPLLQRHVDGNRGPVEHLKDARARLEALSR